MRLGITTAAASRQGQPKALPLLMGRRGRACSPVLQYAAEVAAEKEKQQRRKAK